MKVKELIEDLRKVNPDAEIEVTDLNYCIYSFMILIPLNNPAIVEILIRKNENE